MSLVSEIKNDINGLAALRDWLGDSGDPVHPILAEMRAQRCVEGNDGKACQFNKAPLWWETAKQKAADWIRRELEIKNGMKLRVPQEGRLHMCSLCGCALPLKIWCPDSHLLDHTKPQSFESAPGFCWMKKLLSAKKV